MKHKVKSPRFVFDDAQSDLMVVNRGKVAKLTHRMVVDLASRLVVRYSVNGPFVLERGTATINL